MFKQNNSRKLKKLYKKRTIKKRTIKKRGTKKITIKKRNIFKMYGGVSPTQLGAALALRDLYDLANLKATPFTDSGIQFTGSEAPFKPLLKLNLVHPYDNITEYTLINMIIHNFEDREQMQDPTTNTIRIPEFGKLHSFDSSFPVTAILVQLWVSIKNKKLHPLPRQVIFNKLYAELGKYLQLLVATESDLDGRPATADSAMMAVGSR